MSSKTRCVKRLNPAITQISPVSRSGPCISTRASWVTPRLFSMLRVMPTTHLIGSPSGTSFSTSTVETKAATFPYRRLPLPSSRLYARLLTTRPATTGTASFTRRTVTHLERLKWSCAKSEFRGQDLRSPWFPGGLRGTSRAKTPLNVPGGHAYEYALPVLMGKKLCAGMTPFYGSKRGVV